MYSVIAIAIEITSYVLVPLHISSNIIKLSLELLFMIEAFVFIITIKEELKREMLSLAPTSVKILSIIPMRAFYAGTKLPICANNTISAVCLKIADLPLMLGPVIIMIC